MKRHNTTMRQKPNFYSTGQVADQLGITGETVRRIIAQGHLRAWKVGQHLRVPEREFRRYLKEAERRGQQHIVKAGA